MIVSAPELTTHDIATYQPADWQPTLNAWLAKVAQRSGSERTPAEYARYVSQFLDLVDDPRAAMPAHVYSFAYAPGASGKEPSPSTITVRLAAVRSFFDFLRRMGIHDRNPADSMYVERPRQRPVTPRGLDAGELRRLLAAVPDTPSGKRDRALIVTFTLTGLRRSELLGLRAGDLSTNGAVYYTVRTKGGQERRRELPMPAFNAIVEALEAQGRPLDSLNESERIFEVSGQAFYSNLQRYCRLALLGKVSIHALRHSAAKLRRSTGATLEEVSSFLGHRDLSTTARYLTRLEGETDTGWHGAAAAIGVS